MRGPRAVLNSAKRGVASSLSPDKVPLEIGLDEFVRHEVDGGIERRRAECSKSYPRPMTPSDGKEGIDVSPMCDWPGEAEGS